MSGAPARFFFYCYTDGAVTTTTTTTTTTSWPAEWSKSVGLLGIFGTLRVLHLVGVVNGEKLFGPGDQHCLLLHSRVKGKSHQKHPTPFVG